MKSPLRRRIAPSIPFILNYEDADGTKVSESFRLAYDFNSFTLIEETLHTNLLMDIGPLLDAPSVRSISVLLWAAVQLNHPQYEGAEGLEAIRCNMTLATAKEAKEACSEAFLTQLPVEQRAKLKAQAEAAQAGEQIPLAQSPAPASL